MRYSFAECGKFGRRVAGGDRGEQGGIQVFQGGSCVAVGGAHGVRALPVRRGASPYQAVSVGRLALHARPKKIGNPRFFTRILI